MKLLIGVPATDYMHTEFVKSLTGLLANLQASGVNHTLFINAGSLIHVARDKIASKAINEGYTHVLWLDSDMVFGPDLLDDLMFCGREIVTGVCSSRRPPFVGCLFSELEDLNHLKRVEELPDAAFEIEGCGFACVLTDVEVLRDVMTHNQGTCFLPMPAYGEDLAFCLRARRLGWRIFAEPSVRPGHVSHQVVYYPDAYEQYKRQLEEA